MKKTEVKRAVAEIHQRLAKPFSGEKCPKSRNASCPLFFQCSKVQSLGAIGAPDETVRVNITARESQIARIDALAEAAGLTRSGYMVRAAIGAGSDGENRVARARSAHRRGKSRWWRHTLRAA